MLQNMISSLIASTLARANKSLYVNVRFATKLAGGSTQNGRDSVGKRLGVKKLGG